ncbi:SMI1/KNR4 family protein [Nocardia rhizosphaerihabitans]|uniref:SMI1/KNR4 family protein n=1 Tax=Nocardia rhizosphaerihabitans TaxID=1691570 RepID=UPI00367325B6
MDGNADSLEQAAHALVDTARGYLRLQQREPSPESVEGHLDGVRVTIEGLLDPAVPAHEVAEGIIAAATTRSATSPTSAAGEAVSPRPRPSSHPGDLDSQLNRIQQWARSRLDTDAFTAATEIDIDAVQRRWSLQFPADLTTLFGRVGGYFPTLMPGYDLLAIERSEQVRTLWLDLGADQRQRFPEFAAEFDAATLSAQAAGTASELFLPEFVPVADRDGTTLFVDTRRGNLSGCVSAYSAEGAGEGALWTSVTEMFAALADSLEEGTILLGARPVIHDNTLVWER